MRCKFCGSKAIYPYKNHEQGGAGRVIAGAIIAGPVGAIAGFAGKKVNGYRCSACGMFSEQSMEFPEEISIDSAIRNAQTGNTLSYERYRQKYANIEFVPVQQAANRNVSPLTFNKYDEEYENEGELIADESVTDFVKHSYCPNQYIVGSPVFISNVTIKDDNGTDVLLLDVNNISGKTLRSVYLNITVYDDVGDQISTNTFAFQGLSAATGEQLPQAKPFNLNTNVAYKVDVTCEKAAFTDDSVWRKEEKPIIYSVPERTELVPESFAQYKYLQVLLTKKGALRTGQKLYYPVIEETHRLCVCGNPAVNGSKCTACSLDEADLREVMDYDILIQCRKDVIVKRAKERTEALQEFIEQRREDTYQKALGLLNGGTSAECKQAAELLATLGGYKNATELLAQSTQKAEELVKQDVYNISKALMSKQDLNIQDLETALAQFQWILDFADSEQQADICQRKITYFQRYPEVLLKKSYEEELKANYNSQKITKAFVVKDMLSRIALLAAIVAGFYFGVYDLTDPGLWVLLLFVAAGVAIFIGTGKSKIKSVPFAEIRELIGLAKRRRFLIAALNKASSAPPFEE